MVHPAQPPSSSQAPRLVDLEHEWRCPPASGGFLAGGVIASRWVDERTFSRKVATTNGVDYHTICLSLRSTSIELEMEGRSVHSGSVALGMVQVCAPTASVNALLRDPCDFLHFRVATSFLAARCDELDTRPWHDDRLTGFRGFKNDAMIIKLTQALLTAQAATKGLHVGYVDSIGSAIVTRLVTTPGDGLAPAESRRACGLAKWRLKRAVDYINAHLAAPIHLDDMAAAAGLSRMHFAAQFRAATGLRPREYLLRRRIDQSKTLLANDELPLVDIALSVGFCNQAHFSSVFGRFVGQTPRRWQEANRPMNIVAPIRKTAAVQEGTADIGPEGFNDKACVTP
jgi:AraC family transcriptional regulator